MYNIGLIVLVILLNSCSWFTASEVGNSEPVLMWKTKLITDAIIDFPLPIVIYNCRIAVFTGQKGEGNPVIIGLDIQSGKVLWEWNDLLAKPEYLGSWNIAQFGRYIVFGGGSRRYCIDIETGTTFWKVRDETSNKAYYLLEGTDTYYYQAYLSTNQFVFVKGAILQGESVDKIIVEDPGIWIGGCALVRTYNDTLLLYTRCEQIDKNDPYQYRVEIKGYSLGGRKEQFKKELLTSTRYVSMPPRAIIQNSRYYSSIGKMLFCVDVHTGNVLWTRSLGGSYMFSGFVIIDSTLYTNCEDTYLYAINTETGTIKWRTKSSGTSSELFYMDGVLYYVGGGDGMLHAVDAQTGQHVFKINPPKGEPYGYGFAQARPAGINGLLFVSSWTQAYCYRVRGK